MSSPLNIRLNIDARSNGFDKARADIRSTNAEIEKAARAARAAGAGSALPPGRQSAAAAAIYGRSPLAAGTIAAGGDLRGYKALYYGGAAYATVTATRNLIERGVEFNKTMETGRLGLAALMRSARGDMFADFNTALAEADKAFVLIRKEISTKGLPTTLKDFIGAYSGAATAMYEANIPLEKQVKLIGQITKAISTMGLSADQATQEARALFSGNITKDAVVARRLNITGESINAAKAQGRLESYLTEKFSVFGAALDAGKNTLTAKLAQLTNEIDAFAGKFAERYGEALKEGVDKITEAFKGIDPNMVREAGRIAEQGLRLVTGAAAILVNNMNTVATLFRDLVGVFAVSKIAGVFAAPRGGGLGGVFRGSIDNAVASEGALKAAQNAAGAGAERAFAARAALAEARAARLSQMEERAALAAEIRSRRQALEMNNAMARMSGQRMAELNLQDLAERRARAAESTIRIRNANASAAIAIAEANTLRAAQAAASLSMKTRMLTGFATLASAIPWVAIGYAVGDILITSVADSANKAIDEMSKTFQTIADAAKEVRTTTSYENALIQRDKLVAKREAAYAEVSSRAAKAAKAATGLTPDAAQLATGAEGLLRAFGDKKPGSLDEQALNALQFSRNAAAEAQGIVADAVRAQNDAIEAGQEIEVARAIGAKVFAASRKVVFDRIEAGVQQAFRDSSEKDFNATKDTKGRDYRDMILKNAEVIASESQSTINRVLKASAGSDLELARTRLSGAGTASRASLDFGVSETEKMLDAFQSLQQKLLKLTKLPKGSEIDLTDYERRVAGLKKDDKLSARTAFDTTKGLERFDLAGTKASAEEGKKLQRSLDADKRRMFELEAREGSARRKVALDNALIAAREEQAAARKSGDLDRITKADLRMFEAGTDMFKYQEDVRKGEERVNKARFGLLSTTGRLIQGETDLEQTLKDAAAQRKAGNIIEAQQLELDAVAMVKASQGKVKAPEQVGLRVSDFTDRFSRIGAVTGIGFRADNQDTVAVDTLQLQRKQHSLMEKYLPKLDTIATNLGGGSTIQDA